MARKTKIETSMSENELQEFCKALSNEPNLTLSRLQDIAKEKGVEVSIMGAKRFKDGAFSDYLDRLSKANDLAEKIAAIDRVNTGSTLADGLSTLIMQEVFDVFASGKEVNLDKLSKIVSRIRTGDHRQQLLERQLAEYKRKDDERAATKADLQKTLGAVKENGFTEKTLQEIEQKLKIM